MCLLERGIAEARKGEVEGEKWGLIIPDEVRVVKYRSACYTCHCLDLGFHTQ